jgi:hypothetical protein
MASPLNLPTAFDERTSYTTPERRLMLAIIIAAINDALGCSPANDHVGERERERAIARRWLEGSSRDFREVCYLAGLEPETVSRAALAFIAAQERAAPAKHRGLNAQTIARMRRNHTEVRAAA